jgi:coniferyl-aldehyde dehydrogenase
MNSLVAPTEENQSEDARMLQATFDKQKAAYSEEPEVSYAQRSADLKALMSMLMKHKREIKAAIEKDYGVRSSIDTQLGEIMSSGGMIKGIRGKLKEWMKPQKRHVNHMMFLGGKNRLIPQPLGVVGVIVPWNFPVYLAFGPVATAFAAGNRAMVKMSENSRNLTKLLMEISLKYFPEEKLAFFDETGGVGIEFSKLPFDLLVFTGSPNTAKSVMAAAAKNLTPVILELGGKNPVVIDPKYPLQKAVNRIIFTKQNNAGQICLNVDYVFVHEDQLEEFIKLSTETTRRMVPDINSKDFTAIIDNVSMNRLEGTLNDAKEKGARIINMSEQEINHADKKFPFYLVVNPTPDMEISQRETFGPMMTVRTYKNPNEVVAYINAGERPLAMYVFSFDNQLTDKYIAKTLSGGVTVNDIGLHIAQEDLPFGGVGNSGMGNYHGFDGFASFSKMRPVFYQPRFNVISLLTPPYKPWIKNLIDK